MNDSERNLLIAVAAAVRDNYRGSTGPHVASLDRALSYLKPGADDRDLLLAVARCVGDMASGGRHAEIRKLLEPFNVKQQCTVHERFTNPINRAPSFHASWGRGPCLLTLHITGQMSCECGGVVAFCGSNGGSALFECLACSSRGSRLADREIAPEHRKIMQPTERVDIGAEVPPDIAAAIRDGALLQRGMPARTEINPDWGSNRDTGQVCAEPPRSVPRSGRSLWRKIFGVRPVR